MNNKGHISLAVLAGSAAMYFTSQRLNPGVEWFSWLTLIGAAAGGRSPDLDHKTSTASKHIQFSTSKRRFFKRAGSVLLLLGIILLLAGYIPGMDSLVPKGVHRTAPLLMAAGAAFFLLGHMRSLVLIAVGVLLLLGYSQYSLHWIAAFGGVAFLVLPLVKHRGLIHSPEFAAALSIGLISFSQHQSVMVSGIILGFLSGWWSHLIGDCFGSEGIHSWLLPKLGIALKLFTNGGAAEKMISMFCWGISIVFWLLLISNLKIPVF